MIMISVFALVYANNFFLAFVVDNSEAVEIARKTGKSSSPEIAAVFKEPGKLVFKRKPKNTENANTPKTEEAQESKKDIIVKSDSTKKNGAGLLRFILILFIYFYYKSFFKYFNEGLEECREKAEKIYHNFYTPIFLAFAAMHLIWFLFEFRSHISPEFLGYAIPYHITQFLLECYLFYLYTEPVLFMFVSETFSKGKGNAQKRKAMSIFTRLLTMVIFLVIVPFVLIGVMLAKQLFLIQAVTISAGILIITALIFLIGNLQILYKSIQEPLDILSSKMALVSQGDFDVKTSVLFEDEIGKLKKSFNTMVGQLKEREELRDTFGKYVSIEVAKHLLDKKKVDLGGENIEATILFSDIRNFTSMSERMSPEEVVSMLNIYFSYITEPIMQNNGVINKFIGDAVMAIFTPHLGSEDHVGDGIRSAVGMRERLKELNESDELPLKIFFGVGLNTGPLIAGNIGTKKRFEYTVIGDTVNVASRMESLTKEMNTSILMSSDTFKKISPDLKSKLKLKEAGPVKVKGKAAPMPVYSLEL
jgi:class 3 adenylate cyclase